MINQECIPYLRGIITSIKIPECLYKDESLNNELHDLQHFVKRLISILQNRELVEDDALTYMMQEASQSFDNIKEIIEGSKPQPVRFDGIRGNLYPYFSRTDNKNY